MEAEVSVQGDQAVLVRVGDLVAGKYEVTHVLGKGGMGLVVAARHRTIREPVALKFLLPQAGRRSGVSARFMSEARTGMRIKNPHVAHVHDVGELDDGTPFIVMEHLEGQDLASVIAERGQLPIAEAVDLLMQACEAIAEAHTLGIVHRDLKPSNLFVTSGGTFIKVLDFGISKTTTADDVSVTGTGGVLGSPLYMSPEQLVSPRSVDARADVWALGVVLYEMLAAVPPFQGESFEPVRDAILKGEFPPLSQHRKDVPPPLEQMLADTLKKDRESRLSSVEAFGARLAPFGTGDARASYARIRAIAARASGRPAVAAGEAPTPSNRRAGVATASGQSTEPGLTRTAEKPGPRPRRWRWFGGLGAVTIAAAASALLVRMGHTPWATSAASPTTCAAQGVADCEAKCAAKDLDSCFQLAKILDDGKDAPRDVARAATLYQVGCDGSVARACNNLGALYADGDGVAPSPTKAVDLFKRSCDLGFAVACANLGAMHFEGKGLPKDLATGAIWFFRACEEGSALGCFNASIAYGKGQGVAPNARQSFAYAERACKGGMVRGCIRMETARIAGDGVLKDVQAGLAQLDALCTHEAEACKSLVPIYNKGIGTDVPADPLLVRLYAKKACDLGDKEGCGADSLLLTVDRGSTRAGQANETFATKCDAGDLMECALFGEDLVDGRGVSVNRARGMALLEKACQGKVDRACAKLAQVRAR